MIEFVKMSDFVSYLMHYKSIKSLLKSMKTEKRKRDAFVAIVDLILKLKVFTPLYNDSPIIGKLKHLRYFPLLYIKDYFDTFYASDKELSMVSEATRTLKICTCLYQHKTSDIDYNVQLENYNEEKVMSKEHYLFVHKKFKTIDRTDVLVNVKEENIYGVNELEPYFKLLKQSIVNKEYEIWYYKRVLFFSSSTKAVLFAVAVFYNFDKHGIPKYTKMIHRDIINMFLQRV